MVLVVLVVVVVVAEVKGSGGVVSEVAVDFSAENNSDDVGNNDDERSRFRQSRAVKAVEGVVNGCVTGS